MVLAPGVQLGSYVVESLIGSGGMGEVYRARDTRLNRDVALKVLPERLTLDDDRLARFKREAQMLAALNHPNIAVIYGFETWDAGEPAPHAPLQGLVLEFVDGPTLADRIAQGSIPLDEALRMARQMCDALETAHERAIVHRDFKPANIKLTPDGTVKVLDFGLAKAVAPDAGAIAAGASQSPTVTSPALLTGAGVILGTAAYMSPEQAQGKAADRRSDIWAFGCVLYEMLAATRAFPGENVAETIANVLKSDPDWSRLPSATPLPVRRLLRRCLEKDQRRRLSDIADARLELDDAINAVPGSEVRSPVAERRSRRAWAGAALLSVVATAALVWIAFRTPPGAPEMRLEITTPPIAEPQSLAISPDGRQIVFAALSEGRTQLWLRPIDGVAARPVERTDGAAAPFWSPNGRSLAFFADAQLKRLDLDTGTVRRLADVRVTSGGSWNRDGVVLFSPDLGAPMFRVSASGGTPEAVTTLSRDVRAGGGHRLPEFLPDGRHFLFHVRESGSAGEIWVGDLEGTAPRRLLDVDRSDTGAAYAPSGHLLFIRDATLFAQPFDPVRLQLTGEPVVVAEGVSAVKTGVAPGSPIVYRTGRSGPLQRQLVWFERSGKVIAPLGDPYAANSGVPAMSPDGRQVAVSQAVSGSASDLWLLDATRGLFTRFTNDPFINNFPLWSPDGRHIVFQTNAKGFLDLYQKPVVGTSPPELVVATTQSKSPNDWSADGRWLLYRSLDPANGWDLWALPMEGDRKPVPVVQTSFSERDGQFSPDGRWIAYQSDESGRDEIYIQPFPASGRKVRISTAGGTQVRWRADGRELFYLTLDEELMAAPIQFAQDRAPEPGEPVALFKVRVGGAVQRIGYSAIELSRQQYMVSRDGQRFLVNTVTEEAPTSPITVVLNWAAAPAK